MLRAQPRHTSWQGVPELSISESSLVDSEDQPESQVDPHLLRTCLASLSAHYHWDVRLFPVSFSYIMIIYEILY